MTVHTDQTLKITVPVAKHAKTDVVSQVKKLTPIRTTKEAVAVLTQEDIQDVHVIANKAANPEEVAEHLEVQVGKKPAQLMHVT